ncbi:hypothetical protein [Enhygromyxa salina]|uniref:hypothetical protein n=1 Tax=Enhygromyxa salina TaxID=215803 RepID=UPI0011B2097A|nr:hypothetical protein [Enhygromyxa salina]
MSMSTRPRAHLDGVARPLAGCEQLGKLFESTVSKDKMAAELATWLKQNIGSRDAQGSSSELQHELAGRGRPKWTAPSSAACMA